MKLTGAQIVWESLQREGVEVVFGYPGGASLPIYDALPDYNIHHVLVRHEQGAAHMAMDTPEPAGRLVLLWLHPARVPPTWSPVLPLP